MYIRTIAIKFKNIVCKILCISSCCSNQSNVDDTVE